MKHIKKKYLFVIIAVVMMITAGTAIFVFADVNEYEVCHNITIDLGGGSCEEIYYESQEDRGDNAGIWFRGLRTGENLADWYGEYHIINDYGAAVPVDGQTIKGYYDCVGVTPYVRLGKVTREGYVFAGWEVSVQTDKNYDFGADGIRVYIGAFTEEDITIKAKWERCSYKLKVNTYFLSDKDEWSAQDDNNKHCSLDININDETVKSGVYVYEESVQGDKTYSVAVNADAGWKFDLEKSSCVSGTITQDTDVDIYVRPIEYEVRLYNNKPEAASGNIKNCKLDNWTWSNEGYYKINIKYDTELYIPDVSEVYELEGWTGKNWYIEGQSIIRSGKHKNLTDKDTDILELDALWRENSYNINVDMNGGRDEDAVITTGYEKDNKLPGSQIRPGYNFDSWNTEKDGTGTRYEKEDTVSKLVGEDGGEYTIYAQWKKKDIICLKIASDSYGKSITNQNVSSGAKDWYDRFCNRLDGLGSDMYDAGCVQKWRVSPDGIEQTD